MRIAFLDGCCPEPYDDSSLERGLGGAEATVVRVSAELERRGHQTVVMQHCRKQNEGRFRSALPPEVDHVVVLRDPWFLAQAREIYPAASLYLWSHDSGDPHTWSEKEFVREFGPIVIAPSAFMKRQLTTAIRATCGFDVRVEIVHNIIDVDGDADVDAVVQRNALLFVSAPERGLGRAIEITRSARRSGIDFELHLARPAYCSPFKDLDQHAFVRDHGVLAHSAVLELMQTSLCLLYPNTTIPEAFGLVLGEANALGTPVITHDLGAASEVLRPADAQIVDCRDDAVVIDLLLSWFRGSRPVVHSAPEFTTSVVGDAWENLLTQNHPSNLAPRSMD